MGRFNFHQSFLLHSLPRTRRHGGSFLSSTPINSLSHRSPESTSKFYRLLFSRLSNDAYSLSQTTRGGQISCGEPCCLQRWRLMSHSQIGEVYTLRFSLEFELKKIDCGFSLQI